MSIFSSDHAVMPENDEIVEAVEATETVVTEAAAPAEALAEAVIDTDDDTTDFDDVEDSAEADEADEEPAEPTITFGDLGLPEGVVRKLAQNGVTTPSRSRPRPSRTPW